MENLCLRCKVNPILKNGERRCILKFGNNDKHWDLCDGCYTDCFSAAAIPNADVLHQKEYFKKYSTYGVLKNKSKGGPLGLWYSVRPKEGIDEQQFVKRIKKFLSSVSIEKAAYTFEWKYKQNQGGTLRFGIHCHMLLFGKMKQVNFHIKRQKEAYFNLNEKQKFWIYDKEILQDKIDYMSGSTLDSEKNKEKALDKKSRVSIGLDEGTIYYNCDPCDFA